MAAMEMTKRSVWGVGVWMRVKGGLMLTGLKVLRVLPVQLLQALLPWVP